MQWYLDNYDEQRIKNLKSKLENVDLKVTLVDLK